MHDYTKVQFYRILTNKSFLVTRLQMSQAIWIFLYLDLKCYYHSSQATCPFSNIAEELEAYLIQSIVLHPDSRIGFAFFKLSNIWLDVKLDLDMIFWIIYPFWCPFNSIEHWFCWILRLIFQLPFCPFWKRACFLPES